MATITIPAGMALKFPPVTAVDASGNPATAINKAAYVNNPALAYSAVDALGNVYLVPVTNAEAGNVALYIQGTDTGGDALPQVEEDATLEAPAAQLVVGTPVLVPIAQAPANPGGNHTVLP